MFDFIKIIKSPKFLYLWTSQLLSQVTVHMMNFLLLARLFTVTGSSIATALLWVAYALPSIFFGPIGAASVDLISRRKMLMWTNLLQALTVFGFIFIHESSIFLLYLVVLIYSFLNQFYVPAENASLPSVVSKDNLPQANSMFFVTQQFSLVVGFGLAGIIQRLIGFDGSLIVCSILLFIAFISVSFLPEMKPKRKIPASFESLVLAFFRSIYEGYLFIKNKKTILFPLMLLLAIQISLAIIVVSLPVITTEILKVSISYAGVLVVVPVSLGAIVGSLLIPKLLKNGWRKKRIIEYSLLMLCIVFIVMSSVSSLILTPVILILLGIGFVGANIPTFTYLQEITPFEIRGRVFGNLWFLVTIATIFPVLFSGLFIELFGIRLLLILIAASALFAYYFLVKKGQTWIQNSYQ